MTSSLPLCRARIGAARLVIREVAEDSPARKITMTLQTHALCEVFKRQEMQSHLSTQDKATLCDMLVRTLEGECLKQALEALQGNDGRRRQRRPNQMCQYFVKYISSQEWKRMEQNCSDTGIVLDILLGALIGRMNFINPTEGAKKLVASVVMFITWYGSGKETARLTPSQKIKLLAYVKRTWKARSRLALKTRKIPDSEYMLELPEDPNELLNGEFANMYHKLKIEGCWCACPINMVHVYNLDNSYGCRTGLGSYLSFADSMEARNMLGMHQPMLTAGPAMMHIEQETGDEGLQIQFLNKPKRALSDQHPDWQLKRPRSVFDFSTPALEASPQRSEEASTPATSASRDDVVIHTSPQTSQAASAPDTSVSNSIVLAQPSPARLSNHGDVLLDAMLAKSKVGKRKPNGVHRLELDVKDKGLSGSLKEDEKAVPALAPACAEKPVLPAADLAGAQNCAKASYSQEASRSRFQARSGLKGAGQNKAFKYGAGTAYDLEGARAAAKKWVDDLKS